MNAIAWIVLGDDCHGVHVWKLFWEVYHLFSSRLFLHLCRSCGSSSSIVSDWAGRSGFDPRRAEEFYSSLCVQTGCGAHPASYPVGTGSPFLGGKARLGHDANHSPPSSADLDEGTYCVLWKQICLQTTLIINNRLLFHSRFSCNYTWIGTYMCILIYGSRFILLCFVYWGLLHIVCFVFSNFIKIHFLYFHHTYDYISVNSFSTDCPLLLHKSLVIHQKWWQQSSVHYDT
jgi:hypothetical protein